MQQIDLFGFHMNLGFLVLVSISNEGQRVHFLFEFGFDFRFFQIDFDLGFFLYVHPCDFITSSLDGFGF